MSGDLLRPLIDRVDDALAGLSGMVTLRWGIVTAVAPLQVRFDGDATELPFTPAIPFVDVPAGVRVLCAIQHGTVTVIGVAGSRLQLPRIEAIPATQIFTIDGLTGANRYDITLTITGASAANDLHVRLRAGGVANAAAAYDLQTLATENASVAAKSELGKNVWGYVTGRNRTQKTLHLTIHNLNRPEPTFAEMRSTAWNSDGNPYQRVTDLRHNVAASFDGVWFEVTAGTVSGRFEVRAS